MASATPVKYECQMLAQTLATQHNPIATEDPHQLAVITAISWNALRERERRGKARHIVGDDSNVFSPACNFVALLC